MGTGGTALGVMTWRDGTVATVRLGVCGVCGVWVRTVSRWDSAGHPHRESAERRVPSRRAASGVGAGACAAQQEGADPNPDVT